MTITYLAGDATRPTRRPAIIAHVCNDDGAWGAGFTGAISRRWPQPEREYRRWHRHRTGFQLGGVELVRVEGDPHDDWAGHVYVANMLAQHGVGRRHGPPIRYDALHNCLMFTADMARKLGASLHMPRVGCGLAGGTWDRVEPVIAEACVGVSVFVYDLPEVVR